MTKKKQLSAHVIHDSCCNCRYWHRMDDSEQVPEEDVFGECRRHPPTVIQFEDSYMSVSPEVAARSWCGEHNRAIN